MKSLIAALLVGLAAQAFPAEEFSQPRSFKVEKGGTLEMAVAVGDIRVTPWENDEVSVRVVGIDEDDLDDLRITQEANTVAIRYNPGWYGSGEGKFEVSVPSRFNLDLETSAGEIAITGRMTGKVLARSAGGDMRADDIDGSVEMWTAGGDIRAGDLSGPVKLQTAGGDIRLGVLGGEADVNTSGGDIRIDRTARGLLAHTAGGDVDVGPVGGKADVMTNGGDIFLGPVSGAASLKTAGGNIGLEGATGSVTAQTAGGNIRLDSVTGDVDARTASGNIVVLMNPSGKEKSRLSAAVGNVRLYLPANARATIEARVRLHGGRWSDDDEGGMIRSDFEAATFDKTRSGREVHAVYQVNGGGPVVEIDVSLGNIEIRKAGSSFRLPKEDRKR